MAYILSNNVAYGFEVDFDMVLFDFAFDMTKLTFRNVTIPISFPIAPITMTPIQY
jgi:hypothetical protein